VDEEVVKRLAGFQSTLPSGSDYDRLHKVIPQPDFNPRSQAGATYRKWAAGTNDVNFNPRSQAGAT